MEAIGKVNCYQAYPEGLSGPPPVYVINLANGVTPFMHRWQGTDYSSSCYRLNRPLTVTVAMGHYRPTREEFDKLDRWSQEHVLNGGLLCEPLAIAAARQLPGDPTSEKVGYEDFQNWCANYYGKRLGSQP